MHMYQYLILLIRFIVQYFQKKTQPQPIQPPPEKQETQYEKSCKKYAEFYNADEENSNIDAELYDFDKRKELFADPNNLPEKMWKSRILLENTPRGNVLMYYNPYTHSFYYHSDEQIIPYPILEQVAKKYVVMYRCKDFYIDNNMPENKMIQVLQKEEDALKSKKMKVNDITKCVNAHADSKDVFAALKDYRSTSSGQAASSSTPSVPSSTMISKKVASSSSSSIKFSNKFVRIGKMCEFNILQKTTNKKIEAANELMFGKTPVNKIVDFFDDEIEDDDDDDYDDLEIDTKAKSSYKMFKKLKLN